jgi:hypothetical protein
MRTDCIVELSKLKIFELNTLVQKETSDHVEGKPPPSDTMRAAGRTMPAYHHYKTECLSTCLNGKALKTW